jgi:alanine-synthesizing transaminase
MFSERTFVPGSNWYAQRLARARASAEFIDLAASNPTQVALPYDAAALRGALADAAWLEYQPESLGLLAARREVSQHFAKSGMHRVGPAPDPDQLLLTASTSEAYALLFKVLCEAGDSVLVPEPSYPLFSELARYESVQLISYKLGYDGAWAIDLDSVRRARRADTRAVIVVSPNNPTGNCLTRSEFSALQALELPLIVDEVFADFVTAPVADAQGDWTAVTQGLVFVLDGLSKWAGLPQVKLAWTVVVGDPELRQQALQRMEFVADAYLSVNGITQNAVHGLLRAAVPINAALKQRLTRNQEQLNRVLQGTAITQLHREGGWSVVLRLPSFLDEQAWLERFFDCQIGVQPGWFYDFSGGPFVVVSLLPEVEQFGEGMRRLAQEVEAACNL